MNNSTTHVLGTFTVKSDKLVVSDPCYERGTRCQKILDNASRGTWEARVEMITDGLFGGSGKRVAKLIVQREASSVAEWGHLKGLGVDSGQMSIFCDSAYPQSETGEYGDDDSFYGKVCNANAGFGGLLENGVVTSSGYGDGGYDGRVGKNSAGEIVAIEVTFIDDSPEGYVDEEDEEVICDGHRLEHGTPNGLGECPHCGALLDCDDEDSN